MTTNFLLVRKQRVNSRELGQPECRLDCRQSVVPADCVVDESSLWVEREVSQCSRTARILVIVGEDHSSFTRCDEFVGIKTECRYFAPGSKGLALKMLAMGLCTVFDNGNAVLVRNLAHDINVSGKSIDVDHNDGLRPRGDCLSDAVRIEVPGVRQRVDKNWRGSAAKDVTEARDDGETGENDLVAGSNPQCFQGNIDCCGAVRNGNPVIFAHHVSELGLKFPHLWPFGRDPAVANR